MTRMIAEYISSDHGRGLRGGEPVVYHCNHYNYWLQKTLLLDASLEMEDVIREAAQAASHAMLTASMAGVPSVEARVRIATDTFATLGFGTIDLSDTGPRGGQVLTPVSHYGQGLAVAAGAPFARPQNLFDQGYAAAAVEAIHQLPSGHLHPHLGACQSMGAPVGRILLEEGGRCRYRVPGQGGHWEGVPLPPSARTAIDEPAILAALSGLDLLGNEEGLIPRFGVLLTQHFANFYNRISFEFVDRMRGSGLLEDAEELLVNAGYRCAFNTFGGIMTSEEWYGVVAPQCRTADDWVHGMVAVVNALGWGIWRVIDLAEDRLVLRIYDDYESTGYLGMYGRSERPVSYLALGCAAGLMNLVRIGRIMERPALTPEFFLRCFEADRTFSARAVESMASGAEYTEIVAER